VFKIAIPPERRNTCEVAEERQATHSILLCVR
jgi:hypothetical protein